MGLLGNGDESSLTSNTGWGMMPPMSMNSGADWGSSAASTTNGGGGGSSSTSSTSSSSATHFGANLNNNNSGNHHSNNNNNNNGTNTTNCWLNNNSSSLIGGRNQSSMVSSSASAVSTNNEQALSSSPKLSSSWAQAAGKGLMASSQNQNNHNTGGTGGGSSNNSGNILGHSGNSQTPNNSSNVILQSSSSSSSTTATNNSNAGSSIVSSVTASSSTIANNNHNYGPNNQVCTNNNNYSHDSYSAAINGSNNQQQQTLNSNGTTGSNSAFHQAQSSLQGANSSTSSSENLSGGNHNNNNINNKRINTNANIQDIIGNLCDDVRETLLTEKWHSSVINQDSPWNLPPSPQNSPKETSQWRCPVNSGTEIWENTVRQKKGVQPTGVASGAANNPMIGSNGGGGGGNNQNQNNNGISNSAIGVGGHTNGSFQAANVAAAVGSSQPWGHQSTPGGASLGGTWEDEIDSASHWSPSINPNTGNGVSGNSSSINNNPWPSNGPSTNIPSNLSSNWGNSKTDTRSEKSIPNRKWAFGVEPNSDWEDFGTWNPPDQVRKESGWEKESNEMCKGAVDDGTTIWGNPNQRQTKVSNWKDQLNFKSNPGNNTKNGFNGWNKGVGVPGVNSNGGPNAVGLVGSSKPNQMPTTRDWPEPSSASQQHNMVNQARKQSPLMWNDSDNGSKMNGNSFPPQSGWLDSNSSLFWTNDANSMGNHQNNILNNHQNNNLIKSNQHTKGHGLLGNSANSGGLPSQNHSWKTTPQQSGAETSGHWNQSVNNPVLQHPAPGGGIGRGSKMIQSGPNQFPKNQSNVIGHKKDEIVDNTLRNNQMRPVLYNDRHSDDLLAEPFPLMSDPVIDCPRINSMSINPTAQRNPTSVVPGAGTIGGPATNSSNLSSSDRQTVQLIQIAINGGILNPQILDQPMTSHNMEIVNQLLQQLRSMHRINSTSRNDMMAQVNQIKLNQIKQNIAALQNQIHGHYPTPNPSQASFINRGTGVAPPTPTPPSTVDFFKKPSGGSNGTGANAANDLGTPFDFVQPSHQSRLNQWKAPTHWSKTNNDDDRSSTSNTTSNTDSFSRAPGSLSKTTATGGVPNSWSGKTFPSGNDDQNWMGEKSADIVGSSLIDDYDFDYNKTWKPSVGGTGAKLDDDTRPPFSIPWKSSTTDSFVTGFPNTNTWSYSGNAVSQIFDINSQQISNNANKPPGNNGQKKSTWGNVSGDYNIGTDSLWSNAAGQDNQTATGNNKSRPPPGLSGKISSNANCSNSGANASSNVWNSGSSEHLRLRNLTPQIDGSTLKTLCLQHGPLNLFHLSLNHGVAIVRYATRDQAIKAQSALNNCVLGNTTIIADLPSDAEIQQYTGSVVPANLMTSLSQQQQQQQQQSQSNLNSLASTWSNGTSHSHAAGGHGNNNGNGGGANQSYQSQQTNQQAAAQARASGGVGVSMVNTNNNNAASTSSSNQTLPYVVGTTGVGSGVAAAPVSVLSTHSHSLPFGSGVGGGAHHQYNGLNNSNKLSGDPTTTMIGAGGGWSNPASIIEWNTNPNCMVAPPSSSSTASLWSSSGFSTTDRNTPIQSLLPNDLLAGENN